MDEGGAVGRGPLGGAKMQTQLVPGLAPDPLKAIRSGASSRRGYPGQGLSFEGDVYEVGTVPLSERGLRSG